MKKQKTDESSGSPKKEEEKVFEVPGFFQVASPVRSPRPHCEGKFEVSEICGIKRKPVFGVAGQVQHGCTTTEKG